jgi:hypothetical protein
VARESLGDLRAVAILTETDVPQVVDRWFGLDKYRITGTQRAVREALAMSLGTTFETLEFVAAVPDSGYDILLRPQVDLEKTGWWGAEWKVRMTVTAKDPDGNLIAEATALGKHGYFFLPDSRPAFRYALREACQSVMDEVSVSLERHFAG